MSRKHRGRRRFRESKRALRFAKTRALLREWSACATLGDERCKALIDNLEAPYAILRALR